MRRAETLDVALFRMTVQPELGECPARFGYRPRMSIDSDHSGRRSCGNCPCRAGGAGAASQVDDRSWRRLGCAQRMNRFSDGDEVERSVVEREGCTLSGGIQRTMNAPAAPAFASFDIRRRQCAQRSRDLRNAEIGKISTFRCHQPGIQLLVVVVLHGF